MEAIDSAAAVREGEEIDAGRLREYLKPHVPGLADDLEISQFPGGFSNLTYLIRSGKNEFVLRRPPFGKKARTAHDMGREYRMLSALRPVFPYCPQAVLYCEDPDVMGSPFYVMERIRGIILRKDLPDNLLSGPEDGKELSTNLIRVLSSLHSIDYASAGLDGYGRPEGYVKRQVRGWSERYINSRTPDAPGFDDVMKWLDENMPPDSPDPSVIHNDYKFDNVVLNPENPLDIIGLLDWEMATIGDPMMDLGNSLAYWINRDDPPHLQMIRQMPTNAEGMLTRYELAEKYSELSGRSVENMAYYYCFGLFRLAVIGQQIYYRYYHGQTKDSRFAMIIGAVKILEKAASDVIEKN